MMFAELEVQKYLRSGKTIQNLKDEFGIKYREYELDNLLILNYDQIESPKSHPITIECRSLILRLDDFGIVSRKFDRFYNLGECPDLYKDFSFDDSVVYEKCDGSLVGVYYNYHTRNWEISTRSMALAEGEHILGGTWRDKILDAFGFRDDVEFQQFMNNGFSAMFTYIFEFCSPENRIVVRYDKPQMVLLAVRGRDGRYLNHEFLDGFAKSFKTRAARTYDKTSTIDELKDLANDLPDLEEGFDVMDPNTNKRMKIKSTTYLQIHKMRGENLVPTAKNFLSLVLEGEVDEVLVYFPEWTERLLEFQNQVLEFITEFEEVYELTRDIPDQKDFALKVKDRNFCSILFTARRDGIEPLQVFNDMTLNKKLSFFI